MTNKHKLAFIGCGKRAKQHIDAVKKDGRCDVVALADLNAETAEEFNKEGGFEAKIFTNYKKMLAQEQPDFIITCLWTPLHLPVFRDCAEAGVKAVHSEKPMAPTWGECKEIGRIAAETGCQL
ncbi:MAG: Gfo/Idh/MocA family protein, partial [Candidatus Sumerlaeota bacterium]